MFKDIADHQIIRIICWRIRLRSFICRALVILAGVIAVQYPAAAHSIPDSILDEILAAGSWSTTADENLKLEEQLPLSTVKDLVQSDAVGLLVLSTSAGKWGVKTSEELPAKTDPAGMGWKGPGPANGKHLMSYKTGGVGLPHLDVGALGSFIDYIIGNDPELGSPSERTHMGNIATKLKHGTAFAQVRNDPLFRKWVLGGLRTRGAQKWILEYWLTRYWDPALKKTNGNVRHALILARIWNTRSDLATWAYNHSMGKSDPISAMLDGYVKGPGGKARFATDRLAWMRRPVVLYDRFHKP